MDQFAHHKATVLSLCSQLTTLAALLAPVGVKVTYSASGGTVTATFETVPAPTR